MAARLALEAGKNSNFGREGPDLAAFAAVAGNLTAELAQAIATLRAWPSPGRLVAAHLAAAEAGQAARDGRWDEARAAYRTALELLRHGSDLLGEARAGLAWGMLAGDRDPEAAAAGAAAEQFFADRGASAVVAAYRAAFVPVSRDAARAAAPALRVRAPRSGARRPGHEHGSPAGHLLELPHAPGRPQVLRPMRHGPRPAVRGGGTLTHRQVLRRSAGLGPGGSCHPGRSAATDSGAERRLVSVMSLTSSASRPWPRGATRGDAELLTRYFDVARGVIERHDGTVEKLIGDAVIAVWEPPRPTRTTPSVPSAPQWNWSRRCQSSATRHIRSRPAPAC